MKTRAQTGGRISAHVGATRMAVPPCARELDGECGDDEIQSDAKDRRDEGSIHARRDTCVANTRKIRAGAAAWIFSWAREKMAGAVRLLSSVRRENDEKSGSYGGPCPFLLGRRKITNRPLHGGLGPGPTVLRTRVRSRSRLRGSTPGALGRGGGGAVRERPRGRGTARAREEEEGEGAGGG